MNSIYSNKEVFLRELVSNASDALDKMRFKSLTDESLQGTDTELSIRIQGFPEKKQLVIQDTGAHLALTLILLTATLSLLTHAPAHACDELMT